MSEPEVQPDPAPIGDTIPAPAKPPSETRDTIIFLIKLVAIVLIFLPSGILGRPEVEKV